MYKLVGSPKTRAFRVVWMLEELGAEYEMLPAAPRSDEINALNPSGKVPALLVGDDVITDSSAIIQYLADAHHRFTFKSGTIERARQDSFLHFANDELDGTCWVAAKHKFILPEELRLSEVKKSCEFDWNRALETLEKRLGDNEFVMGDLFTVPDIVFGQMAGWAKFAGFNWREGKVSDYFNRLRARPAFKRAWDIRENS